MEPSNPLTAKLDDDLAALEEQGLHGALLAARQSERSARRLIGFISHRLKTIAAERDAAERVERLLAEREAPPQADADEPAYMRLSREARDRRPR
ncbi:MAG: hypothetical protein ACYCUI_07805 [Vulcanimicrobiaceae bacterium]